MKLTKSIDLSHNYTQKFHKNDGYNIKTSILNSNYYNFISRNTKNSSKENKRKIFTYNNSNDEISNDLNNITIKKIKKNKKRDKSRNSKLTPAQYIKPLFYMLNDRIKAINRQFNGYRNEKYYINFNYNLFSSFKNSDNYTLKTISNNQKEGINENIYSNYMKNINKKNKNKKKKQNCSFDDRLENNRFNKYINYSLYENENFDAKIIKIQNCFRSFIVRYKFYKKLRENNKEVKYSETTNKLVNNYFNQLSSIKKDSNSKKLKGKNKKDNIYFNQNNFNNTYINNSIKNKKDNIYFTFINHSIKNNHKLLVLCKNENFIIKSNKRHNPKKSTNNNMHLIKKQNELLEKEKDAINKEKKLYEIKIKELIEENYKLKQKNTLSEKNKSNLEKLKEENEILKQKIIKFEERNKECEIMENKYKNLVDQNETLYQENLKLNEQIEDKIKNLIEVNKRNQKKIKLYEDSMNEQESLINENQELNKLNIEMKNKMNKLIKENNAYKEKLKNNEIVQQNPNSNNINQEKEKEKLIIDNKKLLEKNEELQNLVDQMKKKISKISKAYKFTNKYINENSGNQSREKSIISSPYELNEDNNIKNFDIKEEEYHNNRELYLKRIRERKLDNDKLAKEEKLKHLFKKRIDEMKDYLHRCFMRFYYNGIFVQMQKRKSLEIPVTKVVKSKRFSELVNKFNSGPNNKIGKIDNKIYKKGRTKSYDNSFNNINLKSQNIIYEEKDE